MKKVFILVILFLVMNTWLFPDEFRIGAICSVELLDKSYEEIVSKFEDQANLFPGFYWEVLIRHIGFGMTYQAKFDKIASELPGIDNEWLLTWIGSMDLRYHIFRHFFIDPFLEIGLGSAGCIELTNYEAYGYTGNLSEPFKLSIFAQIGAGVTLKLDAMHIGMKLDYRFYNDIPPVTDFEPYPLKNFQFALFGGFTL